MNINLRKHNNFYVKTMCFYGQLSQCIMLPKNSNTNSMLLIMQSSFMFKIHIQPLFS